MVGPITVGVIGATGKTGSSVVEGLLSSPTNFSVTSLTRATSVDNSTNQQFAAKGVHIVAYDLNGPSSALVEILKPIDVVISCITWEHLDQQIPWIDAAKEAGVKRFVPSEWVGPAPRGVIDIKDKKLEILGVIQRARLPYTIIDVGCFFQVFVPKVPSGRSDDAHMIYIDHRIVGDGNQKFGLIDLADIGKYVAQIVSDPRTLNKRVFAYTEALSMNEMWDTMAKASGETPAQDYISEAEINQVIKETRQRLDASPKPVTHPENIMDIANYNMGQYRISWCIRGDNTPEYADYLGYADFWNLFPDFPRGRSLAEFYQYVLDNDLSDLPGYPYTAAGVRK
ncbi:NmrA domain-containing protein [Fusarium keratoplasticum]|uniref:NmrA domain-containing protein n=1 Tax=Fusarium keratoplasticum TaxID=1328300 RepID=A0ACC0R6A4_9HYPO|nr:NmrA domain-containing protein [Fusarium keratoplasticum]KAI8674610.1 NmrA domain-containing protein [Fusarium keratoplasticum]